MSSELADWKRALVPCRLPAIAALVLAGVAIYCFNAAKDVRLPYDPAKLNTISLRVDKVASCDTRAKIRGRWEHYGALCVYSGNYPYMVFKFYEATYRVPYTEGEQVEFAVQENDAQLADSTIALQYNMAIPVRVYGVRKNGETLVDAKLVHDANYARKMKFNMNGWIALILAAGAAVITFKRARKILNESMW